MRRGNGLAALVLALALAGCGTGGEEQAAGANAVAAAANEAADAGNDALAALTGGDTCPFRQTGDWQGSFEAGRIVVNGNVDLEMGGMRAALTERRGAPAGTLALDLAFAPAPNEPASDLAHYERRGATAYRRAEIWCGAERIAGFDLTVID